MKFTRAHGIIGIVGIIIAIGLWQVWNFFDEHYPIVNFPPRGRTIVALGDSLTEGVGASSPEHAYIGILERRLGISIINKGVAGDTTEDALKRLNNDVILLHPNILIVLLGGNDYLKKLPQDETFRNLRTIIEDAQSRGAVVLLLGVRGGLLSDKFDADFKRLAHETGSLFIPNVLDGIIGNMQLMSDEVHPNDAGYLKMADKIAPTLEGIVLAAPPEAGSLEAQGATPEGTTTIPPSSE